MRDTSGMAWDVRRGKKKKITESASCRQPEPLPPVSEADKVRWRATLTLADIEALKMIKAVFPAAQLVRIEMP